MVPLLAGYAIALLFFLGLPWSYRVNLAFATDIARTRRTSAVLGTVHLVALALPLVVVWCGDGLATDSCIAWAAIAVMSFALLLQRRAQRLLGSSFTLALQSTSEQEICQRGPYRWIRHPGYLAQILLWIGLAVTSQSLGVIVIIAIVVIAGYSYRIIEEEHMLTEVVGDRYLDYAVATKRLIPGIW